MLTSCRDCSREVSDRATICVHCGRPQPVSKKMLAMIFGIVIFMVALCIILPARGVRRSMPQQESESRIRNNELIKVQGKTYLLVTDGHHVEAVPVREAPQEAR